MPPVSPGDSFFRTTVTDFDAARYTVTELLVASNEVTLSTFTWLYVVHKTSAETDSSSFVWHQPCNN